MKTSIWLKTSIVGLMLMSSASMAQDKGIEDFGKLNAKLDWPWWRGPYRNGLASEQSQPPVTFSMTENVKWKSPVPGRGHSSPIVVGDQVILASADEGTQVHGVMSFDKSTGKQRWITQINQGGFPERNHPKNTEASPTVGCDGEFVFATFFHHKQVELVALDLKGKVAWRRSVGPFNPTRYEYGYAPSPLLYKDLVIVAAEHDGVSYIKAFNRKNSKPAWQIDRPANITFSSPVVAHIDGKDQILLSGSGMVASYDPANGKTLWQVEATTAATCGTMVWNNNIVFASGGYPDAGTYAIEVRGGQAKVLWQNGQKCYEQSMIVVGDHLFALTDNGVIYCWDCQTGKEQWKQRLSGPVSASPVFANGNIYCANEGGDWFVVKANPNQFERVANNKLGEESFASPAISDNNLFLRVAVQENGKRQEYLFCIAEEK